MNKSSKIKPKKNNRQQQMHEVLVSLSEIWKNHPDFRLGQLLCFIMSQYNGDVDPFHLPDAEIQRKVIEYVRRNHNAI